VTNVRVAIIGGGPVGLTMSVALSARGVNNIVLERHEVLFPLPRAIVMDAEIHRSLDLLGVGEDLGSLLTPMTRADFVDASGIELMGIDVAGHQLFGVPLVSCHYQPELDAFLLDRARRAGAEVRMGVEVVDHRESEDGVRLLLGDGSEVMADYVIACDGASSATRRRMGIDMVDLAFEQDWLVVDVELGADARSRLPDVTRQVCDPVRPTTLVRGHRDFYRWEFQLQPGEDPALMNTTERVWSLLAFWVSPDEVRLVRHAAYRFKGVVATSLHRGRVLLAGDAAHQMPPFMGQGLNSGMRDAFNLSWKLAAVIDGHADESLLDTYGEERIPHATSVVHHSVDTGRLIDQFAGRISHGMDESAGYGGQRPQPMLGASALCVGDEAGMPFPMMHELGARFMAENRFVLLAPYSLDKVPSLFGKDVEVIVHPEDRFLLIRPDGYVAFETTTERQMLVNIDAIASVCGVSTA
jgi:2-polyprenyl-6-methoxyphenol hydroxylase-like FAD-dependent oxidoreductase